MATAIPENQARFTLDEVLAATGGSLLAQGSADDLVSVSTDTRTTQPGALFVALRGDSFDAHEHLAAAAKAGARAILVERDVALPEGVSVVRVVSTLDALGALGRAHVERWRALGGPRAIVAITGSAGKTTTRVAVSALVEEHLNEPAVLATQGNLNNRVGVPMMAFCLEDRHRVAVLEMGMNQPGEIEKLAAIARPDLAIVTLVAAAHVEGLGSIEAVAHEKGALFRALAETGIAVGNGDDPRVVAQMNACPAKRRVLYGTAEGLDLRIVDRRAEGFSSSRLGFERRDGSRLSFHTPLIGEAGAYACAAAVVSVEAVLDGDNFERLSGELVEAAFQKADVGGGAGRLVPRLLANDVVVIDDSYNANPASSSASIRTAAELASAEKRRLVLVLGAMYELGVESERGHDAVGRVAGSSGASLVVAVGAEAKRIAERVSEAGIPVEFFSTTGDAAPFVVSAVRPGDLVLVKGSRGVGTERIVRALAEVRS